MLKLKPIPITPLRLPPALKGWIKDKAASNFRSINAEITAILLEKWKKEKECKKH